MSDSDASVVPPVSPPPPLPESPAMPPPSSSRPKSFEFSKKQKEFIKNFLPQYTAMIQSLTGSGVDRGTRLTKGCKGDKKDWILDNVAPAYIKEFGVEDKYGEVVKQGLKKAMKLLQNQARKATNDVIRISKPKSKPRAKSAVEFFAEENKPAVTQNAGSERQAKGLTTQSNLALYRKHASDMFENLDSAEKDRYRNMAEAEKERLRSPPDAAYIFERQANAMNTTSAVLRNLCGGGWDGLGDIMFFVKGVYRDKDGHFHSFTTTVANADNVPQGAEMCPEYKAFSDSFIKFARRFFNEQVRQEVSVDTATSLLMTRNEDGHPLIPRVDFDADDIALPKVCHLLTQYFSAIFRYNHLADSPMPWDSLKHDRASCGLLPHPDLGKFDSLDVPSMKIADVMRLYTAIFEAQERGEFIIKFSGDEASDVEIEEILDGDESVVPTTNVKKNFGPPIKKRVSFLAPTPLPSRDEPTSIPAPAAPGAVSTPAAAAATSSPPPPAEPAPAVKANKGRKRRVSSNDPTPILAPAAPVSTPATATATSSPPSAAELAPAVKANKGRKRRVSSNDPTPILAPAAPVSTPATATATSSPPPAAELAPAAKANKGRKRRLSSTLTCAQSEASDGNSTNSPSVSVANSDNCRRSGRERAPPKQMGSVAIPTGAKRPRWEYVLQVDPPPLYPSPPRLRRKMKET
ncbi:hypothetical protein H0H93_009033 [Arthromyces matolae]|nr:hypothetical protein H0H93_009033 [Arthromyces matolae]